MLNQLASDSMKNDKITLLQGNVIHPSLLGLGFPRPPLKLESVFSPIAKKTSPKSKAAVPYVEAPIPQMPAATLASSSHVPPSTPPTNTTDVRLNPGALSDRLELILDKKRKRVDKPLNVDLSSPYVNTLRQQKLCGWFHLRGKCEGLCNKNHVAITLSAREFDCLWYVIRSDECYKSRKKKNCEDPKCIYGHPLD